MPIVLVYLGAFIVLLLNQSRFIFGGDSAEFSLVARTWSIAHPPGYPLYSLIINIVNRIIPFGTTPWKIATVSSLSTVLASYFIYLILKRSKVNTAIALFSSLFYMVLFPVWEYSEIPEVFALHNLLVIATTYCLLRYIDTKKVVFFYIAAFLVGLSISHHHIFVLFIPGWFYLLWRKQGKMRPLSWLTKKAVIIASVLLILGSAFYLYAPIAASFSPPLNWENPVTLEGFIRLVTRAAYGTFKAYSGSTGNILNQFFDIASLLIFMSIDFRIIGIILIVAGIISFRRKDPFFTFLAISALTHIFFLFYTNFVLTMPFTVAMYERFLIPLYLVLVFFLAFGLQRADGLLKTVIKKYIRNPFLKKSTGYFIPVFMIFYFAMVASQNYRTIRLIPDTDIFAAYAKNLLDTPPKNSIFFVGADNSYFTTLYYRFAENYRPDLKYIFINQLDRKFYRDYARKAYPDVYIPQNYDARINMGDFLAKNKHLGIYTENPFGTSWKPYGLLWKQYDSELEAISDSAKLVADNTNLWNNLYTIPTLGNDLNKILHLNVVRNTYLDGYLGYSRLLFATKHVEEAKQVIAKLNRYKKSDLREKFILVNLNIYNGDCAEAAKIVRPIPTDELLKEKEILPSLKDYYTVCQPGETKMLKLIENLQNAGKQSISNL